MMLRTIMGLTPHARQRRTLMGLTPHARLSPTCADSTTPDAPRSRASRRARRFPWGRAAGMVENEDVVCQVCQHVSGAPVCRVFAPSEFRFMAQTYSSSRRSWHLDLAAGILLLAGF